MKFFQAHVVLLMIAGGWSLDCQVCDEGQSSRNSGAYEDLADDTFFVKSPCKDDSSSTETCGADDDACTTFTATFKYEQAMGPGDHHHVDVKVTGYRCGSISLRDGHPDDCYELKDKVTPTLSSYYSHEFDLDQCTAEETAGKEKMKTTA